MVEEVTVYGITVEQISAARSIGLIVRNSRGEDGAVTISGLQWLVEDFLRANNLKGM